MKEKEFKLMSEERIEQLKNDQSLELTDEELALGYHFCYDWDGLLVEPGSNKMQHCFCKGINKKIHKNLFKNKKSQGQNEEY